MPDLDKGGGPNKVDLEALKRSSLVPGGFGEARIHLWPQLLGLSATKNSQHGIHAEGTPNNLNRKPEETSDAESPVSDERQIKLDTDRSFVLYPTAQRVETLQTELRQLILAVFRRRPKLSYFQGYHDIMSVVYLTLPPDMQLDSAEKLSLHRVRDSMCATLEPVLGLLRILRNILWLADPPFASSLERTSPLPYYALSNLLTLFSHDMPSLPLIQHVFDFLLCRPPIATVYLAAALILARRHEVELLQGEGEEGMIHSLLSGIPELSDDAPLAERHVDTRAHTLSDDSEDLRRNNDDIYEPLEAIDEQSSNTGDTAIDITSDLGSVSDDTLLEMDSKPSPAEVGNMPVLSLDSPLRSESALENSQNEVVHALAGPIDSLPSPNRPKMTLTSLLHRADELYLLYPPTHPAISLSSIMGPQSILFTWSENPSEMPEDDEAESMVMHPELIVKPYVEPDLLGKEKIESEAKGKSRSRKMHQQTGFSWIVTERKTLIAGAVVVLGIGLAVYSIRTRSSASQNGHFGKKIRTWIGKAFVGSGD